MKTRVGSLLLLLGLITGIPAAAIGVPAVLKNLEEPERVSVYTAEARQEILKQDREVATVLNEKTEDEVQIAAVPEPEEPSLENMTPEEWGSLSVHVMNSAPDIWETHKYVQRGLYGRCGEWHDLAISVGWPETEWSTLSYVLYRESRCNIGSHNKTDPMSGSRGLMQINGYWCKKSKWSDAGWLQDRGILSTCDDLYHPTANLRAGLAIWLYGEDKHGCGWRGPWATKCR